MTEIEQLKARIAQLEDVLQYYADDRLYFPRSIVLTCQEKGVRLAPIYSDFGEAAKKVLREQPSENTTKNEIIRVLEDAVRDFAQAGCRHDLNPTMDLDFSMGSKVVDWAHGRFKSMDMVVRNAAKNTLTQVNNIRSAFSSSKAEDNLPHP